MTGGRTVAPHLVGRRVRLVPFDARHLTEAYVGWLNDPVVNVYSRRKDMRSSLDDARAYIASLRADEHMLAILTEAEGHVGNIKFGPVDWPNFCADISILIGARAVWGQGVGAEAMYLVSRYLLQDIGLNRVYADSCNPAFLKLVAKLGWQVEGVLRERIRLGDTFHDDTLVSLLAREFRTIPAFEAS